MGNEAEKTREPNRTRLSGVASRALPAESHMDNEDAPNGWNGTFMDTKDTYALMRDCRGSTRLTAQHYLWKDLLGFLTHPDIPTVGDNLKIADIATGNGIWLHDFARNKPASVELHGFDISLDQVASESWLPGNINMHTWDLFEMPPAEFVGYFDIVHVRLLTVVVKHNDPRPVLQNLLKLLKPGGYLQWDEVDTINCCIKTLPGVSGTNLDKLFSQLKGDDTWKSHLVEIMNENGCYHARVDSYRYDDSISRVWTDVYVSTWKEFAENALNTPEASRELERKAMDEVRSGATIHVPKLVWVARKL